MSKRATVTATFDVPDDAIEQATVLSKLQAPKKAFEEAIREAIGTEAKLEVTSKVVSPSPGRARGAKSRKTVATGATGAAAQGAQTGAQAQSTAGAAAPGNKKHAA